MTRRRQDVRSFLLNAQSRKEIRICTDLRTARSARTTAFNRRYLHTRSSQDRHESAPEVHSIAFPFSCTPVCEHACAYVFDMSLTVADTRRVNRSEPLCLFDPVSRAIGISDPQTSGHEHSKIRAVNAAIGDQLTDTLRLITPIQTFSA